MNEVTLLLLQGTIKFNGDNAKGDKPVNRH